MKNQSMQKYNYSAPGNNYRSGNDNYWIVPNKILCGPFPGLDGVTYKTEHEVLENLQEILNLGITDFVSLCEEIQLENGTVGNFDEAYANRFPSFCSYSYYFQTHKLITSTEPVTFYRFPIANGTIPDFKTLTDGLNVVSSLIGDGKKVFIHSLNGNSRLNIFCGSLLCMNQYSIRGAIKILESIRPSAAINQKSNSSSKIQNKVIKLYIKNRNYKSFDIVESNDEKVLNLSGGMSTEAAFVKYVAYRQNKIYGGWDVDVKSVVHKKIVYNTLKYIVATIRSLESCDSKKTVIYSPGFLSVHYIVELCDFVYIPSQFLIKLNDLESLRQLLAQLKSKNIDAYAVVGYDGCVPNSLVAWIKFRRIPEMYIDLVKNYLKSDNFIIAGVNAPVSFGENVIHSYGRKIDQNLMLPAVSNISHDIYFLHINSCYSGSLETDWDIFDKYCRDFDRNLMGERSSICDWESGIDNIDPILLGLNQHSLSSIPTTSVTSDDTMNLYLLSTKLSLAYMRKNNIEIQGLVANPYIITNPLVEASNSYLSVCYWQMNPACEKNIAEMANNYLKENDQIIIHDYGNMRTMSNFINELSAKYNVIHINNENSTNNETTKWAMSKNASGNTPQASLTFEEFLTACASSNLKIIEANVLPPGQLIFKDELPTWKMDVEHRKYCICCVCRQGKSRKDYCDCKSCISEACNIKDLAIEQGLKKF